MFDKIKNISELITYQAKKFPDKTSIALAKKKMTGGYKYPSYTFTQLDKRINKISNRLSNLGVKPSDKVLFFVKPNLDFSAITFALFRLGATTVFIDPGMKKEYFLEAIEEVKPDVLIGIPRVHIFRHFKARYFANIKLFITTGKFFNLKSHSIYRGLKQADDKFTPFKPSDNSLAAILYTSGGTGKPKGVCYTHNTFIHQTKMLQKEFNLTSNDVDIPGFPLFSFFTLALGMKSCIPDMDAAKPGECDPSFLYRNIIDNQATFAAGSPAIWERLADYCLKHNLTLPSIKRMTMFGAPVTVDLHQKISNILPNGTTYTPYGATECLPVTNTSGEFILKNTWRNTSNGDGVCVGKPMLGIKLKIIKSNNDIIDSLKHVQVLAPFEIGEIIVTGANVTENYYENERATILAKIRDGNNIWHRMGDVGYLDEQGLLWFCGRKAHVVSYQSQFFYPIQIEAIYNQHPKVKRSALVAHPKTGVPTMVIERHDRVTDLNDLFLMDMRNLSQNNKPTKTIKNFFAVNDFPVDTRHNIKIDRIKLAEMIKELK